MSKGGSFERTVAKMLSLWWSNGERDDIFYRSHASGGRFTVRRKSGKDTALQGGDITASDPLGEPLIAIWSIEVKTGYGTKNKSGVVRWDVLDYIDSKQKETVLEKMWKQSCRDAELTNREPVLIFRRNGRTPCIMFSLAYIKNLKNYFGMYNLGTIKIDWLNGCFIMPLNSFFDWIPDIRSALCSKTPSLKISKTINKRISHSQKD